jgi:hypothetical protein
VHPNPNGVENNLAGYHRDDEDYSGVEHSAQGGAVPFRPGQRCGQPGENRHIPYRIDRRPDRREIFANLDQERRHVPECALTPYTNGRSSARQSWGMLNSRARGKRCDMDIAEQLIAGEVQINWELKLIPYWNSVPTQFALRQNRRRSRAERMI